MTLTSRFIVALLDWPNTNIRVDNRKAYAEIRQTALAEGSDGLFHVTYTIRLSADVLEPFKGMGPGWQTCLDETLRGFIQ